jgi:prepilin-type N-terminal cleavage/methylation domain-containing protein
MATVARVGAMVYSRHMHSPRHHPSITSTTCPAHRGAGFSLVELSIVMAILGLLVGAVVAGRSFIQSSELLSINRELQQYQAAIGMFKTKYGTLPGDMPDAVSVWGAQAGATTDGADATCAALTTGATGTATCNGDGNGVIGQNNVGGNGQYEVFRTWQHLANAGMVSGKFTGIPMSSITGDSESVIGENVTASRFPKAGWTLGSVPSFDGDCEFSGQDLGVLLIFGGYSPEEPSCGGVLLSADAYGIDIKTDDGVPSTGKVLSSGTSYTLTDTTTLLSLIFRTDY